MLIVFFSGLYHLFAYQIFFPAKRIAHYVPNSFASCQFSIAFGRRYVIFPCKPIRMLYCFSDTYSCFVKFCDSISFYSYVSFTFQEQKRYTEQLLNIEREGPFGTRVSPYRLASAKKVAGPKPNGSATNGSPGRRLSISTQQFEGKSSRSAGKDGKKDAAAAAAKTSASLNEAATAKEEDTSIRHSDTDPIPCSP
jgi:hypothetical protein